MIGMLAAAAVMVACPAVHDGTPLQGVAIFDGAVSDNAILAPDTTRRDTSGTVQTWRVEAVYRDGRVLHLRCDYPGRSSVTLAVPHPVRMCRMTWRGPRRHVACA